MDSNKENPSQESFERQQDPIPQGDAVPEAATPSPPQGSGADLPGEPPLQPVDFTATDQTGHSDLPSPPAEPEMEPAPPSPGEDGDTPNEKGKGRRKAPLYILIAVLLLAGIAGFLFWTNSSKVQVVALSVNDEGLVAPDSRFLLKAAAFATPAEWRERIATDPETVYDIVEGDEAGAYLITPLRLLDAGGSFSITVDGRPFLFQVENRLMITSSFPADGAVGVPVHSGIEFEFNTRDLAMQNLEEHFSIQPSVPGSFTYGDGRFVFYPEEAMAFASQYTVTLGQGMSTGAGAVLAEDHTISFTTVTEEEQNTEWMFQFSRNYASYNTLPDEPPLLQLYLDSEITDGPGETEVEVVLHAYPSWESYRDAMSSLDGRSRYYSSMIAFPTEGLREHARFTLNPIPAEQGENIRSRYWLLEFPDTLPEGWYTATFTTRTVSGIEIRRQLLIQSSGLSFFYMQSGEGLVAWLNDTATGQPVDGAAFTMSGSYQAAGSTDENGMAVIDDGFYTTERYDEGAGSVFTITHGERVFIDRADLYNYYGDSRWIGADYVYYLFSDRPIYHTTDTLEAWGMVRPRVENPQPLEDLRLSLSGGALEQPVELAADGTFRVTLSFENLVSSYWSTLALMSGEETITETYLRIEDFVKPVYTATTAPAKPVYLYYEEKTAAIDLEVTTFDGTPVAAFPVAVNSWGDLGVPENTLYTDDQGRVELDADILTDYDTWYPQSYYYQFRSDDAQQESFYRSSRVHVIHRDLMLRGKPEFEGNSSKLTVTTHGIDTRSISDSDQLYRMESIRGAAVSTEVAAELHHVYYTKEVYGTYYDFINRETRESYTYRRHDDLVDTFRFTTTEDGAYTMEGLPVSEEGYYYVDLSAADSGGARVAVRSYLGCIYERDYYRSTSSPRYLLNKVVSSAQVEPVDELNGGYSFPDMNTLQSRFQDNEAVTFRLENNDEPMESLEGRILFGVVQDRFTHTGLSTQPTITLPYSEELLPNYILTGAYFDGRHVYVLEDKGMYYDPVQRELEITLGTDRQVYGPGEDISVSATVTNAYTGNAAAETTVVLSVVDEAIFALQEQSSDILESIYQAKFYPDVHKYASYTASDLMDAGEKGGGGGDPDTRTDFQDTALFATAVTDAAGRALFSFQLPDNITSWRLTSLALSPESHAGSAVSNVSATKEYFLLPVVSEQILEGDTFFVGLRGSGSGVSPADISDYTVTVEGEGVSKSLQASSSLRAYESVRFDGLPRGDYTVTIRGTCKDYSDAIQLPFTVAASGVEISRVDTVELKGGLEVDSLRYPVSLRIYDSTWKNYNLVLRSVYGNSHGGRADMRLARRYAALQSEDSFYSREILEESIDDINGADSLLSLFPYAGSDVELSVKARLALPDLVSDSCLTGLSVSDDWYLGSKAAVYLAQVLADGEAATNLSALLENGSLDYVEQVYIALAMALSGQEAAADTWYAANVTPRLIQRTGYTGDVALYVDGADAVRSVHDCTAAATMLATVLEKEDAHGLVRYLAEKPNRYEPYLLEQLLYLTRFTPSEDSPSSFRYLKDGETITETLGKEMIQLYLNRRQLEGAGFQVLTGQVFADVYYTGSPGQEADISSRIIGLNKTIEPVDSENIEVGSVVKVTLVPDFSGLDADVGDTVLIIDDYIPSGMRFEGYDYNDFSTDSWGWYMNSRQGQRLQFTIYGAADRYHALSPIVYYARCAAPGDYVVESAYITGANSDAWGATERGLVTID